MPANLNGYRTMPESHKEAFAAVDAYVQQRKHDYRGFMTQMLTGYGHYTEMYGAKWGTQVISLEVGENIINTQSKYSMARASSRRFGVPWSAQVSPWHGPSVTTSGPLRQVAGTWQGEAAGHSTSLPADVSACMVRRCGHANTGEQRQLLFRRGAKRYCRGQAERARCDGAERSPTDCHPRSRHSLHSGSGTDRRGRGLLSHTVQLRCERLGHLHSKQPGRRDIRAQRNKRAREHPGGPV